MLAIVVQDESIVSASIKDLDVTDEGYAGFELSKKMSGVLVLTGVGIGETEVLLGYPGCAAAYKFNVTVLGSPIENIKFIPENGSLVNSFDPDISGIGEVECSLEVTGKLDIISCGDGECNDQETPEPSLASTSEPPAGETPEPSLAPTSEPPAGETPEPSLAPTSEPPVVKTPEPSPIPTSEPAVTETPDSGQESTPEPIPTLKPSETLKPVEMPTEAPTATPEAGVDKKPAATVAPNPSQIPPSEPNQTPDPDNGELSSGAATDSSSGSGHESSVSSHSDNKDSSTNSPRTGEDSSSLWLAVLILITGGIAAVIKVAEELKRNH